MKQRIYLLWDSSTKQNNLISLKADTFIQCFRIACFEKCILFIPLLSTKRYEKLSRRRQHSVEDVKNFIANKKSVVFSFSVQTKSREHVVHDTSFEWPLKVLESFSRFTHLQMNFLLIVPTLCFPRNLHGGKTLFKHFQAEAVFILHVPGTTANFSCI